MHKLSFLVLVILTLTFSGCGPRAAKAPRLADGSTVNLSVVLDRGIDPGMNNKSAEQHRTVGDYMERTLVDMARRAGYRTVIGNSPADFVPQPGSYLLDIRITRYNPGSKAARMIVGFGAGAVSLDVHFRLSDGSTVLLDTDDGVGSSIDWPQVVHRLNQKILNRVTQTLAQR